MCIGMLTLAKDDEVICQGETMLRRSGTVDVTTIPSHIAKTNAVKKVMQCDLVVLLIRRNGKYLLEIKLEGKEHEA